MWGCQCAGTGEEYSGADRIAKKDFLVMFG